MKYGAISCTVLAVACGVSAGSDWRQFRGTDGSGVADDKALPVRFGPQENVAWKAALPGPGPSSPVVVAGRVIVTAATGPRQERLHVLAFDAATGKPRWERQLWATGQVVHNPFGGVAGPTPASDGRRIFALFSSNDLVCFDLDGNLQWFRGLAFESPMTRNDVGMASSLLVAGDTLIAQLECPGESFATGIDVAGGETRWRLPREQSACWASPTLMKGKTPADDLVLLQSRNRLTAHEPRSGKQVWSYEAECSTVSSAAVRGEVVYLPANGGIVALRHDPATRQVQRLWEDRRLRCENVSPVVQEGRIYTLKSASILVCGDAAKGEVLWQSRLEAPAGTSPKGAVWATPVVAGDLMVVVNHEGLVRTLRLGANGALAGAGQLGPGVLASPAIADGAIYFRDRTHLWRIAKTNP